MAETNTDWKDKCLYVMAEVENIKKQSKQQSLRDVKAAEEKLLMPLLEIVDNFKRADHNENLSKGVVLVYFQILNLLEKYNTIEFVSLNKPFDPNIHEAIETRSVADCKHNMVVEVIQTGYIKDGKLFRPAKVAVSKNP